MKKLIIVTILAAAALLSVCRADAAGYKEYLEKGRDLIENCRHKEAAALELMLLAYKEKPNEFDVIFWTARAFYETREYEKAKDLFEKAVKLKPNDVEAHAYLGYTYGRIGENLLKRAMYMLKSAEEIKKVVAMNPKFSDAYFSLAIACTYLGWYEKPTGVFRKMVQVIFKDEKLVDEFTAEGLFKKAIALDPDDAWYYVQSGWLYLRTDRPKDAQKMFDKAMALAAKDTKCGMKDDTIPRGIAIYYEDAGKFKEGLKYAKTALEWNPKDVAFNPRFNIGKVIDRLEKEVKSGKPLLKNVADEL